MPHRLDATELLVAEVVALRAAFKHLLVEIAVGQNDPNRFIGVQFERASDDIDSFVERAEEPDRAAAIAEHAREILEEIYTITLSIE